MEKLKRYEKRERSHHNSGGAIAKYIPMEKIGEEIFLKRLEEEPLEKPRAIYVHTPYCDKICSFCNLNRKQIDGSLDSYADFIADEFEKYGKYRYFSERGVDVIYFGGGTPTVYNSLQLEKILKSIRKNIILNEGYEFTFESTLHNLTMEKLEIMKKYGVNRLSIGVQSFNEEGRKFYNRTYGKNEVIDRIREIRENFDGAICSDIIYNYPGETIEDVRENARVIAELGLSSSSFYGLMVHEGSALSKDISAGAVELSQNLEYERALHDTFVEELLGTGKYHILELTKIAKIDGDSYRYIKTRNSGGDTFPIGVGAGGNVGDISIFRMGKEMSGFVKRPPVQEKIDRITGRFQFPNIEKEEIVCELTPSEKREFLKLMEEFKRDGLLLEKAGSYMLTKDGLFWGNNMGREILKVMLAANFPDAE